MDAETGRRSWDRRVLGARSTLARSLPSRSSAKHERRRPVSFLDVSIFANLLGAAKLLSAGSHCSLGSGRVDGSGISAVELSSFTQPPDAATAAPPPADTGRRSRDLRMLGARSTLARSLPSKPSAKHERLRPVSFFEVIILVSV